MDNTLLITVISAASGVFVLDRVIALIKALRSQSSEQGGLPCAISHEQIRNQLQRLIDTQDAITDILREIASEQKVLMDRRPNSLSPKLVDLIRDLDGRRKVQREVDFTDPPPASGRRK